MNVSVLICEAREGVAGALLSTVKSLDARCKLVASESELYAQLKSGGWSFVFVPGGIYDNLKIIAQRFGPDTTVIPLASAGEPVPRAPYVLTVPVDPSEVADILNGRCEIKQAAPKNPGGPAKILDIEGLDTHKGLAMSGGSAVKYANMLSVFIRDAFEKLGKIKASLTAGNLHLYSVHTHAIKGAAVYIGAIGLSEAAKALEMAGKRGDTAYIEEHNPGFTAQLETLLGAISKALSARTA
jgi:HPt (histidine-containing phosphotransfer) domain-containing protein